MTSNQALITPAENRPKKALTILGTGDRMGEGDTELVPNLLPADLAADAFEKVRDEVKWNTMIHRGMHHQYSVFMLSISSPFFQAVKCHA